MTERVIEVRGLRKSYGDLEAVAGVDLHVDRGEVVALLGPNGAGKTTTVEILEGLRKPDGGDVRVLGLDVVREADQLKPRIGVSLQTAALYPKLTVVELLDLFRSFYPKSRPTEELIEALGLGERRRLDVALALIGDPQLVFLDEPTTGFDPAARRAAWDVVAGLRDLGVTVVLTTHYMEEAERLADRIYVLVDGAVRAEGTPATLGGRDCAAATIALSQPGGADLPVALLRRMHATSEGRLELRTTAPARDLRALAGWAVDAGVELYDIEVRRPTLEDVYLELIA